MHTRQLAHLLVLDGCPFSADTSIDATSGADGKHHKVYASSVCLEVRGHTLGMGNSIPFPEKQSFFL